MSCSSSPLAAAVACAIKHVSALFSNHGFLPQSFAARSLSLPSRSHSSAILAIASIVLPLLASVAPRVRHIWSISSARRDKNQLIHPLHLRSNTTTTTTSHWRATTPSATNASSENNSSPAYNHHSVELLSPTRVPLSPLQRCSESASSRGAPPFASSAKETTTLCASSDIQVMPRRIQLSPIHSNFIPPEERRKQGRKIIASLAPTFHDDMDLHY